MTNQIIVPAPDDWHGHLRSGEILIAVAKWVASQFRRIVAMGNDPAILTVDDAKKYDEECNQATKTFGCTTLVSPKINRWTTPEMIEQFFLAGFHHLKFYFEGTTTAAEDGVSNIYLLFPVFEVMQNRNMVLQIHAEVPGTWSWVDTAQREAMCLPLVYLIHQNFPRLRIVIEHISCAQTVAFLEEMPRDVIGATATYQHLRDYANDVRGGLVYPDRIWKPEAKTWTDRDAIRTAVFYKKLPNVFNGNDWAPHIEQKKGPGPISSGGFQGPGLLSRLLSLFLKHSSQSTFADFTWRNGADFYQVPKNRDRIVLVREQFYLPEKEILPSGNEIRIYRGGGPPHGEPLEWKIATFV